MKFADLVDIEELRGLCESYTTITGAVTALEELDGTTLIATGSAPAIRVEDVETPHTGVGKTGSGSFNVDKTRILLTDDDPVAQLILPRLLKYHGYSLDVAVDGKEALQALEEHDYALVLMDCMMPGMTGYEVAAVIRDPASSLRRHDIPIIALTGNAMKDDHDRCIAVGMNDHLPKPLILDNLLVKLEYWLNTKV